MRITQETDYAVRIVYCLARESARMDAGTISGQMAVTPRFALKILHKLTGAGIVKSYKGAHGGYELARRAEEITMKDVMDAVEGPTVLSRCIGDDGQCNRGASGCCSFQRVFAEISTEINGRLAAVDFATLLREDPVEAL